MPSPGPAGSADTRPRPRSRRFHIIQHVGPGVVVDADRLLLNGTHCGTPHPPATTRPRQSARSGNAAPARCHRPLPMPDPHHLRDAPPMRRIGVDHRAARFSNTCLKSITTVQPAPRCKAESTSPAAIRPSPRPSRIRPHLPRTSALAAPVPSARRPPSANGLARESRTPGPSPRPPHRAQLAQHPHDAVHFAVGVHNLQLLADVELHRPIPLPLDRPHPFDQVCRPVPPRPAIGPDPVPDRPAQQRMHRRPSTFPLMSPQRMSTPDSADINTGPPR